MYITILSRFNLTGLLLDKPLFTSIIAGIGGLTLLAALIIGAYKLNNSDMMSRIASTQNNVESIKLDSNGNLNIEEYAEEAISGVIKGTITVIDINKKYRPVTKTVNGKIKTEQKIHYKVTLAFGNYTYTVENFGLYTRGIGTKIDALIFYEVTAENEVKIQSIQTPSQKEINKYLEKGLKEVE